MEQEIILQDNDISVLAPKKAVVKGHLVIIPNQEMVILEQIPEELIAKMFQVANKLSSVLFDNLGCQGTNIIIQNGVPAGQINNVFSINIIPRFENDGLNLEWEPKKASEEELESSLKKLSSSEEEERQKKVVHENKSKAEKPKDDNVIKAEKDNYLTRSIERLP